MYTPDYLAVLVAALIPQLTGALWYGPLFGQKWMQLMGKTEEEIRKNFSPARAYGITFLMSILMAYVLAHILQAWDDAYAITGWTAGLQGGFFAWLGFVLTVGWQSVAFEDRRSGVYWLGMAYNLVSLLAMGALLGVWR